MFTTTNQKYAHLFQMHLVHWNTSQFTSPGDALSSPNGLAVLGLLIKVSLGFWRVWLHKNIFERRQHVVDSALGKCTGMLH